MAGLQLTVALEHYDRHLPLLEGRVVPEGIDLRVVHVTVEGGRHERMLDHWEWEACELSLGSYMMARARGAPLTAIPVFPRRLYSQSQMYVNTAAGIAWPPTSSASASGCAASRPPSPSWPRVTSSTTMVCRWTR